MAISGTLHPASLSLSLSLSVSPSLPLISSLIVLVSSPSEGLAPVWVRAQVGRKLISEESICSLSYSRPTFSRSGGLHSHQQLSVCSRPGPTSSSRPKVSPLVWLRRVSHLQTAAGLGRASAKLAYPGSFCHRTEPPFGSEKENRASATVYQCTHTEGCHATWVRRIGTRSNLLQPGVAGNECRRRHWTEAGCRGSTSTSADARVEGQQLPKPSAESRSGRRCRSKADWP